MAKKQKVRVVVSMFGGTVNWVRAVGGEVELTDVVFLEDAKYADPHEDEYRVKNRDGVLSDSIIYAHISDQKVSMSEEEFELIEDASEAKARQVPQDIWELQEDDPRPGDYPLGEDDVEADDEDGI